MISITSSNLWTIFQTFGGILECLILIYTIGVIHNKKFQFLEKRSPYWIGTLIFLLLCINNIPYFFKFNFGKKYFRISNSSKIYEVNNVDFTDFYSSSFGKVLWLYKPIIMDIILLTFEMILNFYSLYLFQKQIKKKNVLVKPFGTISSPTFLKSNTEGRRNFLMIIVSCSFSLIQHLISSISFFYFNYSSLFLVGSFSLSFRNSVNFLFFYIINTNFKRIVNKKKF